MRKTASSLQIERYFLLDLLFCVAPPTPGIRIALSQHAIDIARVLLVNAITPILDNVTVPFIYVDEDTIAVNISDIRLSQVSLGNVTAELDPSNGGVTFAIANLCTTVNANFYVRSDVWPNPSGTGTAVITVSGASAGVVITVSTLNEHVNVTALNAYASAGNLGIQLNGNGITWAINLLKGVITKAIANLIATKVPGLTESFMCLIAVAFGGPASPPCINYSSLHLFVFGRGACGGHRCQRQCPPPAHPNLRGPATAPAAGHCDGATGGVCSWRHPGVHWRRCSRGRGQHTPPTGAGTEAAAG